MTLKCSAWRCLSSAACLFSARSRVLLASFASCLAASTQSSRCLREALIASSRSRKITFSKAFQTLWYK